MEGEVLGHEGTGIVVDLGDSVRGFARGEAVTALGGAYGEYFLARCDQLVKLPPSVPASWALGEPVACCVHGAGRSGVRIGDRVAIVGCGFMGLVWMQLLLMQGAGRIEAFDLIDWRLDVAAQRGADKVHAPDYGNEEEFDVVVEAAGTQGALNLATRLVRQHGRVIIVGYHQSDGGVRNILMKTWNFKAIDVVNAHVRNEAEKLHAMESAILLIEQGKIRMQELVTEYRLADVSKAFDDLLARKRGLFKAELAAS
jgi:threonine dehydrogenase-like Zn-dependent dehydrogenase